MAMTMSKHHPCSNTSTPAAVAESVIDIEQQHELLVTYEGPFHPSVVDSSPSSGRKTFCITLPPSPGCYRCDGSRGQDPSYVTDAEVLSVLSAEVGWPPHLMCISRWPSDRCCGGHLFPDRSIQGEDDVSGGVVFHQHPPLTVTISSRLSSIRGGKGGFGTLLKGQSKQAGARTTLDFGACRDLSGRRLRHVNDEIKLRKFRELQERRERGVEVDELAALKTPSGIRNWHLMVPTWSEGAAFSNKGRRRIEQKLEREVRGLKSKEERTRMEREQKKMKEEWATIEYVRRGEVEGQRTGSGAFKTGILEHMRKRKQMEKQEGSSGFSGMKCQTNGTVKKLKALSSVPAGEKPSSLVGTFGKNECSLAVHLMTLSGEMSVYDAVINHSKRSDVSGEQPTCGKLRIQSQSDFATAVVLLDVANLTNMKRTGAYMEYTIQTAGLAQVGWIHPPSAKAPLSFLPNSDTGDGVGDDAASFGYDGSRGLKFHNGKEVPYGARSAEASSKWKANDVLGCWCRPSPVRGTDVADADAVEIGYSLNGIDLGVAFRVSATGDSLGLYPAVSLNLEEAVEINTGPDFAFMAKKGCVGVCDLVIKNNGDEGDKVGDASGDSLEMKEALKSVQVNDAPIKAREEEGGITTPDGGVAMAQKNKVNLQKNSLKTFDLNECSSIGELKEMGADGLKEVLLSMGVKCGGTLDERAKRLFSLKGLRRETYPKKVRGKNFVL